jgi:hypothetical protein
MRVYVTDKKVERMKRLSKELLLSAQRNRRLVSLEKLRYFCGVAVSLTLALPLARFCTRTLYWDVSLSNQTSACGRHAQTARGSARQRAAARVLRPRAFCSKVNPVLRESFSYVIWLRHPIGIM